MTSQEVIELLSRTGHLHFPFGARQDVPQNVEILPLTHPAIVQGVASYQDFMPEFQEQLCMKHHKRIATNDGLVGPATEELFSLPRCGCADYSEERAANVQAALGTGSWKGCHGVGEDYHAATMFIDKRDMPSFWEPILETVWERFAAANAEIGLRWTRTDDKENANTVLSWETRKKPYIGLALVGKNEPCNGRIWLQILASYQPADLIAMLTELLLHEGGHNMGCYHTRGGIMNASIMKGLPATWIGDPSEPILRKLYGGVPIPDSRSDEYWVKQCWESNKGKRVCVPVFPPILVEGSLPF